MRKAEWRDQGAGSWRSGIIRDGRENLLKGYEGWTWEHRTVTSYTAVDCRYTFGKSNYGRQILVAGTCTD
jgi:hypothetical protein